MGVSDTNAYAWMQVSNSANLASGFTKDLVINPVGGNLNIGNTGINSNFRLNLTSPAGNGGIVFVPATDGSAVPVLRMLNAAVSTNVAEIGTASGTALYFSTAATERARITSGGNFGIGTTSPTAKQQITSTSAGAASVGLFLNNNSTTAGTEIRLAFAANTNDDIATNRYSYISALNASGNGQSLLFATNVDGASAVERARITSDGNLLVNITSNTYSSRAVFFNAANTVIHSETGSTGTSNQILFLNPNGIVGSITTNGSATLYNTTSDQRLKENIQDAESASSLIDSLKVRKFDWKESNVHQRYGFVAQELVTVAPEAVHQPADTEAMMAVDYSKLVPMLVKEIQSLRKRLADAGIA